MFKNLTRYGVVVSLFLGSTLLVGKFCFGQSQVLGKISGVITDSSGAVVPGAKITATNKDTGQTSNTTTNDSGYYVVLNLPAGTYDVGAEKEGFERCVSAGVHLDPAGAVQLTCTMTVGKTTEVVTVSAEAQTVQTEEARVARVISDTQIQNIPVNGRNFATLLALQPGVVQEFSFNNFESMDLFATQGTHVNGMRGDANNLLIEGAPSTRTRANGAMVAAPSIDAISEINIVTTGYMPEYSRGAGGQLILQMRSGTEAYHGGAYEFVRNDDLDARNFFSSTVSVLKFNNFGYNFGGPVLPRSSEKKLFFFWSQEWSRIRTTGTTVATVPTALMRQGNLSESCAVLAAANADPTMRPQPGPPCPIVPSYLAGQDGLTFVQPPPQGQSDLRSINCALSGGSGPGCFPNETIPQDLWSSNGMAFVQMMAPPTNSSLGSNFIMEIPSPSNERKETIKVDYDWERMKSRLAVSLRHYSQDGLPSWGTSGSSQLLQIHPEFPERGATVDLTTNFSPTLLNDFTFAATEDIVHVNLNIGSGLNRSSLGVTYPYIFGDASKDVAGKIPTVNVNGFDTISGLPYPSGSVGKVFVFQDTLTKLRAAHLIKIGFWVEQDGENDRDQVRVTPGSASGIGNNLNGTFTFDASNSATTTTAPLADAFLGTFGAYSELGFRNYTPWVSVQKGWFVQDSWKMRNNFTLQGGLRWDYFPPYHSRWCNFAAFDPLFYSRNPDIIQTVDATTGNIIKGNAYNGIAVPCQQLPREAIGHFAVFGEELTSANYEAKNQDLRDNGMLRGLSPSIFQSHYDLFEPRLGFAWDPFGKGTTSVRAGGGIFYNHFTLSDVTLMGGNTPFQLAAETLKGTLDCESRPFLTTSSLNCYTAAPGERLPIPMTGGDLLGKVPGVYQWNVTVQHLLPQDTLVEVGYVGTRGRHLVLNSDLNQLPVGKRFANPGVAIPALAPYPGLGGLTVGLNDSNSSYNSLQISAQRRMTRGLQYGVAYTYSHSFDYGSSLYANAVNTYDLRYNYGPSDWNRKNNLVINYVYEVPFFKQETDWKGRALGGWEVAGVAGFQSGTPNTVINATGDEAGVGEDFGQHANLAAGCNVNRAPRSVAQWFNASCFTEAAQGTFGNAGRSTVWGPPTKNWDFALYKNGKVTEKFDYQFRAEFFNFLNHPSFNAVDVGLADSSYGRLTGANNPRQIQFGLKLSF